MKHCAIALIALGLIAMLGQGASAREPKRSPVRRMRAWSNSDFKQSPGFDDRLALFTSAQTDTYCIVYYDFEQMNWQGWTRHDETAQPGTFTHVDDFGGLGGGRWGGLVPLEGLQSMWCGARPDTTDPYMCSWMYAPGYGNSWDQSLETNMFSFTGLLTLSFIGHFDSEPDWDITCVEYDAGRGNWTEIATFDGVADTTAVLELHLVKPFTKLRFHFTSDGSWSDQDGLWDTDGAFIVDSIAVSDEGGLSDYEDFEGASPGNLDAGIWHGRSKPGFGIYSELRNNLLAEKDPCNQNFATQITFIEENWIGPPWGIGDTPFCKGPGGIEPPCQNEYILSPFIDMTRYSTSCDDNQDTDIPPADLTGLGGALLRFTVFADLPVQNCVAYTWKVRNIDASGCPTRWLDRYYVFFGDSPEYKRLEFPIGDLVSGDQIQVSLHCIDLCASWYGFYCNCATHTPAPWFDNVQVVRYRASGVQWNCRDLDLFQDTFPGDAADIESPCRADMANNINSDFNPNILPGDSIVVSCNSLSGDGIRENAGGPEVYMHVRAEYIGPSVAPWGPKPQYLYGPSLEGSFGRYVSDDGSMWTVIQAETSRVAGWYSDPDHYMFDLNDSLFTRGYMISYYFEAFDNDGSSSTLPAGARELANLAFGDPPYRQVSYIYEFTCLPTGLSDVLYVDDFHGRGTFWGMTEQYWNQAIHDVIPAANLFDRYDVNSPSSMASNGPGSRAKLPHLFTYRGMIWDSGDLETGTITANGPDGDKSNDAGMLVDWMTQHEEHGGLLVFGDGIAEDLDAVGTPEALALLNNILGASLASGSYFDLSGGIQGRGDPLPLVVAAPTPGIFSGPPPDTFVLDGGCPSVSGFDVLEKTCGDYALAYPDFEGLPYYAAIQHDDTSIYGKDRRSMLFGFSFMYILDHTRISPIIRNVVFDKAQSWLLFGIGNPDITGTDPTPHVYELCQNYPNPFNPVTTIRYSLVERGHVSLRIFDVAGRLVRTLVDDVRESGPHSIAWNGRNSLGIDVSSGIYFYRLTSKNFNRTRKMVLLR